MTISFDVGAKQFRTLEHQPDALIARTCSTACSFLPDKPSVRHLMEQSAARYVAAGDQLVVWGQSAEALSQKCAVKSEHLLTRNPLRKQQRTIASPLQDMLARLVPTPEHSDEYCVIGEMADDYHADWLKAAVTDRDYRITMCSPGLAAGLAELGRQNFTGLAMVFGATQTEAVLLIAGEQIIRCELPRGGDAIDQSIAIAEDRYWWSMSGFRELETDSITAWKTNLKNSVMQPANARAERLLTGYHQLASELITSCESAFAKIKHQRPLPVVIAGAAARVPGFLDLMQHHFAETTLDIDRDHIRLATDDYTIARGLLIHGELLARKAAPEINTTETNAA